MNKKLVIYGGGTVSHIRNHLALCAPAYGTTAKRLAELGKEYFPNMDICLKLTKMAGGRLETNLDVNKSVLFDIADNSTKVIIMSAAICDFDGKIGNIESGKYSPRLKSDHEGEIKIIPSFKIISQIRKDRKDIFLVGFKTTNNLDFSSMYLAGLDLCKKSSCNLVVVNDTINRKHAIVTPEESHYGSDKDRDGMLRELMGMIYNRSHLTFTRSTVVDGVPVSWNSSEVPSSLRRVVNYCIINNSYRPFNGVTAGHFAVKLDENTFLSSIRKTDFNKLDKVGLVRIKTDGPDNVIAYGSKPSVGGQSQRIIFSDHKDVDCVVHFHCPIRVGSKVPIISQKEFECGSHECGRNTSNNLKKFGNLYAVYLDNHGPNIVFNRGIDSDEVIKFIESNFDLSKKTGGYV